MLNDSTLKKPLDFLLAVFILSYVSVTHADTISNSTGAALIQQACQMGNDDAKNGRVMDSTGISLKNANGKYIELETRIRNEYEKCFRANNSLDVNAPVISIEGSHRESKPVTSKKVQSPIPMADTGEVSMNLVDVLDIKLPPYTSYTPFAWFHDWMSVLQEAPGHYTREMKRAENLRRRFKKDCQAAYTIDKTDRVLVQRWCNVGEWKDYKLAASALYDDLFKKQLEEMQVQIGYSELAYSKNRDRDVKNAFDRAKGEALDYKMAIIEETKVLPYLSGINIALSNSKAVNMAIKNLDTQLVSERKREYLAELKIIEQKRIEEEKKQLQQQKHERLLKQKKQAESLLEGACNKGREDAKNLKKLQPDQFKHQAERLEMLDKPDEKIAGRFTECYDAQLISLTCKKAGDDYMNCRDDGPPVELMSLASNNQTAEPLKAEYKKCQQERKDLYIKSKVDKEISRKKILRYAEIYREKGGYFINDYTDCVASLISAANKSHDKLQFMGLSENDLRSCENISSVLEKYANQRCSCNYGVVIERLNINQIPELSDDIIALIKLSHSDNVDNPISQPGGKKFMDSLIYPDEAVEMLKKIAVECAM